MENNFNNLNYMVPVAQESETVRAQFYKKTYATLAMGVLAFIILETIMLNTPFVVEGMFKLIGMGKFSWLIVIGAFMGITWYAQKLADNTTNKTQQYSGFFLYTFAEALIFVPIMYIALSMAPNGALLAQAGILTLALFGGLTGVVFGSSVNFSFMRSILTIGFFLALGVIIAGMIFGFDLGLWFSLAMVGLASGSILYSTWQIKNEYAANQYIPAALSLFASLMLLFWYILRILMSRNN
ncbi:Bax inhibitor-1/YccA family protein [Myroides marinus]|uniref:Bax inhibitor-1/YccA family protein n=1 Tax=Myroides marinus TaxID=703342 RepID=UPI00257765AD|nr:Bax inhibitor-1 family protein [Myroides marinus]MDM1378085.1 Bax inhibitor-1 family protein [Myroides marinus]MDM1385529.1 Bax inhibitor-1 family protein [Myroides marinus]MDM1392742.1 Bax inhibitor-1 family protein [Myroides marinus]